MSVTQTYLIGTTVTLLSTELNSEASSAAAASISSVGGSSGLFNNTYGGGGLGGYILADYELSIAAPAGTLTAGTAAFVWFLRNVDGTDFEDGGASVIPARPADLVFPVRAVATAQRIILGERPLPLGNWYVLLSQSTGQTWAASGNTLKAAPATYQGV